ncbi:MAG: hypothetical protein ACYC9Z_16015 [Casimicrobiaceae bacterium]
MIVGAVGSMTQPARSMPDARDVKATGFIIMSPPNVDQRTGVGAFCPPEPLCGTT